MTRPSTRRWIAGLGAGVFFAFIGGCANKADASAGQPVAGDLDTQIAQRIEVRENPSIFAVFTLLNAAGYDEETATAMHPVRLAVRRALPRLLSDTAFLSVAQYYRAHPSADLSTYAAVATMTSGPPAFTPTAEFALQAQKHPEYRALSDLPALLRMFTHSLPFDSLYRVHELAHRSANAEYAAAVRREIMAVLQYARVKDVGELTGTGEFGRAVVIPSLLVAYDRAYSFVLGDVFYSIEGPQTVLRYNPHEFIHAIVNPGSTSYSTLQIETLVRAVALRYPVVRESAPDSAAVAATVVDSIKGFPLEPYIYRQLAKYEQQSEPLRAYYPHLFDEVKR